MKISIILVNLCLHNNIFGCNDIYYLSNLNRVPIYQIFAFFRKLKTNKILYKLISSFIYNLTQQILSTKL